MTKWSKKKLESHYLSVIVLGGSICTVIFFAGGYSITIYGPASALLGYAIVTIIVYFLMTSLAEMASHTPSAGSLWEYSSLYVGKSFSFANDVSVSPYTLVFKRYLSNYAVDVFNFIILQHAYQSIRKINKNGIPTFALLRNTVIRTYGGALPFILFYLFHKTYLNFQSLATRNSEQKI